MVPCAGTTGGQESRHPSLVLAGPSCSLRLLTPHSRCSQFSPPGAPLAGPAKGCTATWRHHEMPRDAHWQSRHSSTGRYQIAPPALGHPPATLQPACWSPVRSGPPSRSGPARMVRRSMTPWPASRAPPLPLRLSALPTTLFLAEPRTIAPLLSPALIVTATPTPCTSPCVGALFVCDAISGSHHRLGCQTVSLPD